MRCVSEFPLEGWMIFENTLITGYTPASPSFIIRTDGAVAQSGEIQVKVIVFNTSGYMSVRGRMNHIDYMVFLNLWGNSTFFCSEYNILHSCEHFTVLNFPVDILMSMRRFITVFLFKISMKISGIGYIFMYLLGNCIIWTKYSGSWW